MFTRTEIKRQDSKAKGTNTSFFQPKLSVNQPNDIYEQEADAMADRVMRIPAGATTNQNSFFKPAPSMVQRDDNTGKTLTEGASVVKDQLGDKPGYQEWQDKQTDALKKELWDKQPDELKAGIIGFGLSSAGILGSVIATDPSFRADTLKLLDGKNVALPLSLIPHHDYFPLSSFKYTLPTATNAPVKFDTEFEFKPYLDLVHQKWSFLPKTDLTLGISSDYAQKGGFNVTGGFIKLKLGGGIVNLQGFINQTLPATPMLISGNNPGESPMWLMRSLPDQFDDKLPKGSGVFLTVDVMRLPELIQGDKGKPDIQRKCEHCEDEEKLQRKESGDTNKVEGSNVLDNYVSSLGSKGQALPEDSRQFFEPRFGSNFSDVRVHTDDAAAKSAQSINAFAYTSGNNIVFNSGQYAPDSEKGKRLMAHELTHVVQQNSGLQTKPIQRDGMGDVHLAEACDAIIEEIRSSATYKALSPDDVKLTEEIIVEIGKKYRPEQYSYYLPHLKMIFTKKTKTQDVIATETAQSTVAATQVETARVAKPAEAKNTKMEEKAASDPARAKAWIPIKGKFGGGTYYVDRRSATDIVVRASVLLKPVGKGKAEDVTNIKKMEDGIEKAASTKGYLVDITFVDVADADTFTVEVDTGKWEVATNWAGGDPTGFAHELHHMFAFELDRYNYIDSHSGNDSMEVHDRLYWFRQELKKPAGYNDPTSIMDSAAHPNDSDVCTVAGLDMKTCMDARKKLTKP
jgi:hypothetical protein